MKRIFTSIWFLAFIIAGVIIILLPPIFKKYKVKLDYTDVRAGIGGSVYFEDLRGDGTIHEIESFQAEQNYLSFQVFEGRGRLFNQFNFPYSYNIRFAKLFFFDTDEDGLKEVFGFTFNGDSIIMSYVEPYDSVADFKSVFITELDRSRRKEYDASVSQIEYFDFDGDSNKELVFSIPVGYNWFPRKLFVFHPESGDVERSEEFGVHFSDLVPFDFRDDGKTELLCVSSSADNIPHDLKMPYTDDQPRLFVFDSSLEPIFPPVEFPVGIGSRLKYFLLDEKSGDVLALYNSYSTESNTSFVTRFRIDQPTENNDTLFLDYENGQRVEIYREAVDRFLVITANGEVFEIDDELNIISTHDLEFSSEHKVLGSNDFFEDGTPEYYTSDINNSLHIFLDDFTEHILLNTDLDKEERMQVIDSPVKNQFVVVAANTLQFYTISENPLSLLKVPFYILIYFLTLGILWLWQWSRTMQMEEKYELQKQVHDLKLKSFRNQLNPHFIFNTFNGVASVIKKGDTEKAYEVFMRFSKMTRTLLDNFDKSIVSLEQEMELVGNYIELQKFRFKDLFDYQIEMSDKSCEEIAVPRMIVQIHVENAIRHGLLPKDGDGFLRIQIAKINDKLNIAIEDNGIGREASKLRNKETSGIGLITIQRFIDEINANNKSKIRQEIVDLKDENGKAAGTLIKLEIPLDLHKTTSA